MRAGLQIRMAERKEADPQIEEAGKTQGTTREGKSEGKTEEKTEEKAKENTQIQLQSDPDTGVRKKRLTIIREKTGEGTSMPQRKDVRQNGNSIMHLSCNIMLKVLEKKGKNHE